MAVQNVLTIAVAAKRIGQNRFMVQNLLLRGELTQVNVDGRPGVLVDEKLERLTPASELATADVAG